MKKRVVIIGGVAGGASAAARLRRLDEEMEIIIIEKGDYISYANCGLPYYIGGIIGERDKLFVQTPEGMRDRYNIQVRTGQEVTKIDREKKEVEIKGEDTGGYRLGYDILLLAPGAFPVRPRIPGINGSNVFTLRNVGDTDQIKNFIREMKPKTALVVGAGFIGLEMVENLHAAGLSVSLVEMAKRVLFKNLDLEMAVPIHKLFRNKGISLYLSNSLQSIEQVSGETWAGLKNGERIGADLIIMAVGAVPDNKLAKEAGLVIGESGGIEVNEFFQTSDSNIYAVGDVIEIKNGISNQPALIPLAGPANRQGRLVADKIAGRAVNYEGAVGTSIAKIFELTAASVGLTEDFLRRKKVRYFSSITHSFSNATYYPGAFPLTIKLNFTPDGRIWGAQAVGYKGVDKRLDVLATVIKLGGKVTDLTELELAYAPPYSSAKDPVNIAGYVASNILSEDMKVIHWSDLPGRDQNKSLILDVREIPERQAGYIEDSLHIPLPELRKRIGELPRDKEIIVYCQVGLRAYIALRILKQYGFEVRNLSGGYHTWKEVNTEENSPQDNKDKGNIKIVTESNSRENITRQNVSSNEGLEIPRTSSKQEISEKEEALSITLNACGLQCPGPIMRVAEQMKKMKPGEYLRVLASDPGFPRDIKAWAKQTGNDLVKSVNNEEGFVVLLRKGVITDGEKAVRPAEDRLNGKTMVVFSGDLDKAIASFIIANGAASMGRPVTMFFTFWGLNILRKIEGVPVEKNPIEKIFAWMMPRGSKKLALSRMNMAGMGGKMIRWIMKRKNVFSLEELIEQAKKAGVRMVACQMSMDLMGIKETELIDGVEIGGVASYLASAEESDVNLFI